MAPLIAFTACVAWVTLVSAEATELRLALERHPEAHASVWDPAFPSPHEETDTTHVQFTALMNRFIANVSVGTPSQVVSLALDLSMGDVAVLNHEPRGSLFPHNFYDHANSTTYRANGTQVEVTDAAQRVVYGGFTSQDRVSILATRPLQVANHPLVELVSPDMNLRVLLTQKMDGFLGLGPARADFGHQPSIVRAMITSGLLKRPEVGLLFSHEDAHVVFGGIGSGYDHADFTYFKQRRVSTNIEWAFPIKSIQVDDRTVSSTIGSAVVSTFPFIHGPAHEVQAIREAVGTTSDGWIQCDGPGPDITWVLGDTFRVTMKKDDYIVEMEENKCVLAVIPGESTQWRLGTLFLRHVYTVLEFGSAEHADRIGFASLKLQ